MQNFGIFSKLNSIMQKIENNTFKLLVQQSEMFHMNTQFKRKKENLCLILKI